MKNNFLTVAFGRISVVANHIYASVGQIVTGELHIFN